MANQPRKYSKLDYAIGIFFFILIGSILAAITYRIVRWIGGF